MFEITEEVREQINDTSRKLKNIKGGPRVPVIEQLLDQGDYDGAIEHAISKRDYLAAYEIESEYGDPECAKDMLKDYIPELMECRKYRDCAEALMILEDYEKAVECAEQGILDLINSNKENPALKLDLLKIMEASYERIGMLAESDYIEREIDYMHDTYIRNFVLNEKNIGRVVEFLCETAESKEEADEDE